MLKFGETHQTPKRCHLDFQTLMVTILRMISHPENTINDATTRQAIPVADVRNGIIIPGFIIVMTMHRKNGISDTINP